MFENVVCEMLSISSRPQCVKGLNQTLPNHNKTQQRSNCVPIFLDVLYNKVSIFLNNFHIRYPIPIVHEGEIYQNVFCEFRRWPCSCLFNVASYVILRHIEMFIPSHSTPQKYAYGYRFARICCERSCQYFWDCFISNTSIIWLHLIQRKKKYWEYGKFDHSQILPDDVPTKSTKTVCIFYGMCFICRRTRTHWPCEMQL